MDDSGNRNNGSLDDGSLDDGTHMPTSANAVLLVEPSAIRLEKRADQRDVVTKTLVERTKTKPTGELRPPMGMLAGAIFGLASAVLYTMANIGLRKCVGIDPFLVSAVKAAPTVLLLGPFLGWMLARGETVATSPRMIPRFMFAALVGQFIGNAAFQVSLGMIGLAVAVPITLGMMIVGAAVLGRVILHEPVRIRTGIAMLVLIASVVALSIPAGSASGEVATAGMQPGSASTTVWIGSLYAAASGAAYALFGVVMRQALTGGLSAPLTMFISGSVGTISLWSVTFLRIGMESLTLVGQGDWAIMFTAGMLNFTAFVALSAALKSLPVVAVNLINASQVAMAAVAGIVLFAEPVTASLVIGIALTLMGLGILAGRRRRPIQSVV